MMKKLRVWILITCISQSSENSIPSDFVNADGLKENLNIDDNTETHLKSYPRLRF